MTQSFTLKTIIIGLIFLFFSCNSKELSEMKMDSASADSTYSNSYTSSSAAEEENTSNKKFIRTGDVKFKVHDVVKATYEIESTINKFKGFVTYTNLSSKIDHHSIEKISADSSLETTRFNVVNSISFRVPNTQLDTVLKSLGRLVEYMDYRIIKAEDVTLQVISNDIHQVRIKNYEKRLMDGIDNKGRKLPDLVDAEETLLNKQQQADNSTIANLQLHDQIQYSTVNLDIYQTTETNRKLIANFNSIRKFEPWFGGKLLESLEYGWEILEAFILFIARFWGFTIMGVIVFLLVRKYKYKLQKA
jgi:hypothetical protein